MYNFLKKIIVFAFGLIVLMILRVGIIMEVKNNYFESFKNSLGSSKDALFIWGDSQTYQGLDIDVLEINTDKAILSSAVHGAGIYDFLIFTQSVPRFSDVLVAISIPVQIRMKNFDYNKSGLSLFALKLLYENNYSMIEILQIIKKNLFLTFKDYYKLTHFNKHSTYNYDNKIITQETTVLEDLFKTTPPYFFDKQNLYKEGLENLKKKDCKINLIKFPLHSSFTKKVESYSTISYADKFYKDMIDLINCNEEDTLVLNDTKQPFYDITHLNVIGANKVSKFLSTGLKEKNSKSFTIVHSYLEE